MEFKKIIHIDDNTSFYQMLTCTAKKPMTMNLSLGEVEPIFDGKQCDDYDLEDYPKSLFPQSKVIPIHINALDLSTAVSLRLRPEHYLINTTFLPNDISHTVKYSLEKKRLTYIFFNFNNKTFTLNPRITKDTIGLLDYFGNNLNDNLLRQTILDFFKTPNQPKDILKNLLLERAENYIIYRGATFDIKYGGKKIISLNRDESISDLVYIIKNKVNLNPDILWDKRRKTSSKDALSSFKKNYDRGLKKIRQLEDEMKIAGEDRFSEFVSTYIKIDLVNNLIVYKAPLSLDWQFDLPEEFDT